MRLNSLSAAAGACQRRAMNWRSERLRGEQKKTSAVVTMRVSTRAICASTQSLTIRQATRTAASRDISMRLFFSFCFVAVVAPAMSEASYSSCCDVIASVRKDTTFSIPFSNALKCLHPAVACRLHPSLPPLRGLRQCKVAIDVLVQVVEHLLALLHARGRYE